MAKFTEAYNLTNNFEGGYVNDKDDRGGETYSGVARKRWPDWEGWEIIDNLKSKYNLNNKDARGKFIAALKSNEELHAHIEVFYKLMFWDKLYLDKCIDQDVANELYDTAVNQGVRTATKYLQRSLNILNRDQRDYKDLKVDGLMGPNTTHTLNKAIALGFRWKRGLLKCLNGEQYIRYRFLALFSSKQEKYMHGWLRRVGF